MLAVQLTEMKDFMSKLFLKDTFDSFQLVEAQIVTANSFQIDGRIKKEYYSDEDSTEHPIEVYSSWEQLRPISFQLIKGKKTPLSMKLVFRLNPHQTEQLVQNSGLTYTMKDVDGFFFNIRYENNTAHLTTGTSMRTFTLDKSLENFWDQTMLRFLKKADIDTE